MPSPTTGRDRVAAHVGIAGFDYADWEGRVYPQGLARGRRRLEWIARFVRLIEINSSFYGIPSAASAAGWAEAVAGTPDFRFTAKLWQGFTHAEGWPPAAAAAAFRAALEPLCASGRLLAVLVQFPWKFADGPAARERLVAIAHAFGGLPLVLEVRHASFGTSDALDFVRGHGFSLATLDMPRSKASLAPHDHLTGPLAYVRLHGRNVREWFRKEAQRDQRYDYLYAPAELARIVERVRRLADRAEATIVVANNHFRGQALANALELEAALTGGKVAVPEPLLATYPRLLGIAADSGGAGPVQRTLFS
jgi:uncharacterized protein YecE (DUF72 family)